VKLLLKFFLNTDTRAYLRGLAEEFGDSTNSVRVELNRLTRAGILTSSPDGRTRMYVANSQHPLFGDLKSLVKKYTGIDQLIDKILSKLGTVEIAFITGDYARGIDSGIIDLVIVGTIDRAYLMSLVDQVEELIKRKIRPLVLSREEYGRLKEKLEAEKALIVWGKEISS
jgi:hypothetical protein